MRHSILHTAGNVVWVARNDRQDALPLLSTYLRLKLHQLLASRNEEGGVRRTKILDLSVAFFDYYWLIEMFEEIFLRGQYYFESERQRPLIIDVGSNIGLSILFFKKLFPGATIFAFEPDPETFGVLAGNVRENGLEDVVLRNEAVYDGTDAVFLYGDPETAGSPQKSTRSERMAGTKTAVRATRLSEHITETVDFLKIDIEGAEQIVIDELERSGKLQLVDRIAVEYHHHLHADDDELSGLLSALERNGFGYQLEARLDGPAAARMKRYQNVLVHAYRKDAVPAGAREGL